MSSLNKIIGNNLLRFGGAGYSDKVLGYGPIAYWPLWEAAGAVAECQVNPAQNGSYTGVTLGQPGIGDGNTCPLFDGANDFVNVHTLTFDGVFDGQTGSIAMWARVSGAGVWTDGTIRRALYFGVDTNNNLLIGRTANNNQLQYRYRANAVIEQVFKSGVAETDWMFLGLTWSLSADQVKAYYYAGGVGGQEGATQVGLGAWAGNLALVLIGAAGLTPIQAWDGYIAHVAVWDSVLPLATFDDLAVV